MDAIAFANDISTGILTSGSKISLLSPTFGIVIFLIERPGIIELILKKTNFFLSFIESLILN